MGIKSQRVYRLKNKLVFISGAILILTLVFWAFMSPANAATINTSLQVISITPKIAAVGEKVTITGIISPEPPSG
jgi:type II secretory pathway component PulM